MKTRQFSFYFHYEPCEDEGQEFLPGKPILGNYCVIYSDEMDSEVEAVCSHLTFNVEGSNKLWDSRDQQMTLLDEKAGEMEKHGVHDWRKIPYMVAGFDSYEIHPDDQFLVMEEWKKWFEDQGFTCSPIVVRELDHNDGSPLPASQEELSLYGF